MATPCASGGKTAPTLPLPMPWLCTERASLLTALARGNNPRSGARLGNRGARDAAPPAQLAATLHGGGGKTAPTLPLRMPWPRTERPSPLTAFAKGNNPRFGAQLGKGGARGPTPPAQLAVALHAAGGKTVPTLPLRMQRPRTERAPPLWTLARGNNWRSGARLGNRGARGAAPPAQLAAALHGAGGKTAPTLPLWMPETGTKRPPPRLRLTGSEDWRSGSRSRHCGLRNIAQRVAKGSGGGCIFAWRSWGKRVITIETTISQHFKRRMVGAMTNAGTDRGVYGGMFLWDKRSPILLEHFEPV